LSIESTSARISNIFRREDDGLRLLVQGARARPVISITYGATAAAVDDSPVAYGTGSKQIFATHCYDASLGLTPLVPDRLSTSPATYVVYLNRSRIDQFDGVFGGITRRIVAGRARTLVGKQLQRQQGVLAASSTQKIK
jgi:hypothetical protein